ncbi:MAG: DegV family protein [Firmicutes bacterium]|nr:DegV family protein [Bacillota bacterium]
MRKLKIVADSGADIYVMDGVDYVSVPLTISAARDYVDTAALDKAAMVADLALYNGKSHTACPAPAAWLAACGEAEEVFCVTISRHLSGSYNAACVAAEQWRAEHPAGKIYVLDSLSVGPEMLMHVQRIAELAALDVAFEDICVEIEAYRDHCGVIFSLESLHNLANNGRVNPLAARLSGLIGIRVVGDGTGGVLNPTDKLRGEKKALQGIVRKMREMGYDGHRVQIDHVQNESGALALQTLLRRAWPEAEVSIAPCGGLCSFYAEKGGLIVGFETKEAQPA